LQLNTDMMKDITRLFIVCIVGLLFVSQAHSQEEKYITLYLYNFTKHIEWPDEYKGDDFVIDVLGHTSVYEKLKVMLKSKNREGQNFIVNHPSSVDEIDPSCNILFLGHWKSKLMDAALKRVGDHGTLIVTEKSGMLDKGSDINLVIRDQKIMYEVKKSSLEARGLSFSLDLTSLAQRVVD